MKQAYQICIYAVLKVLRFSISASAVTLLAVPHGMKVAVNDVPGLTIFIVDGAGSSDPQASVRPERWKFL